MKVVINTCYGGFTLSHHVMKEFYPNCKFWIDDPSTEFQIKDRSYIELQYEEITGKEFIIYYNDENGEYLNNRPDNRHDPKLIEVIERLGCEKSSGNHAELKIVEIPDGIDYIIQEYDGIEWIAEKHRTWS